MSIHFNNSYTTSTNFRFVVTRLKLQRDLYTLESRTKQEEILFFFLDVFPSYMFLFGASRLLDFMKKSYLMRLLGTTLCIFVFFFYEILNFLITTFEFLRHL